MWSHRLDLGQLVEGLRPLVQRAEVRVQVDEPGHDACSMVSAAQPVSDGWDYLAGYTFHEGRTVQLAWWGWVGDRVRDDDVEVDAL